MKIRHVLTALSAVSLVTVPVAAQAQSAERESAPVSGESGLSGSIGPALIITALAAAGMIALLVTDNDNDDAEQPISA